MTTRIGTSVVSEHMARHAALKASPPWPQVFALLVTVPEAGMESMPEGDQSRLCWKLMQLMAGTSKGLDSALTLEMAHVLIGRENRSTTDLYRAVWSVRRLREMTREDVAEFAKRYGLELA